jgi:hypothetical protein
VIALVLAATAVPVELRSPRGVAFGFGIDPYDLLVNICGYVPIGAVLAVSGAARTLSVAALMAVVAETSQVFMVHRDPSVLDIAANIAGATVGLAISRLFNSRRASVAIGQGRAAMAAILAASIVFAISSTAAAPLNDRGASAPGILEARWKLDVREGRDGRTVTDTSGHGHVGIWKASGVQPRMPGNNARLTELTHAVDFGRAGAFRLAGSMTIGAWIKATSHPPDDAAIVSSMNAFPDRTATGFQLDTTVDQGQRTIAFKLSDSCGHLMARYGATPLQLDTWYHVTGVYDAEARAIDVYLNGRLDNGSLIGAIDGAQRSSRSALFVGRRSDLKGFEFVGSIDDVHVYSLALAGTAIDAMMRGLDLEKPQSMTVSRPSDRGHIRVCGSCTWNSEREDARLPGAVAVVGALVAIACIGFFSHLGVLLCGAISLVAGLLLFNVASATLPLINGLTFPLTSLIGGLSVALSVQRPDSVERTGIGRG